MFKAREMQENSLSAHGVYRVVLSIVLLLFCSLSLEAKTWTVCPGCNLRKIGDAIRHARPGDTILVKTGTYREGTLVVDRPVRIVGEGYPVVDGNFQNHVIDVRSDGVALEGLVVVNSGMSDIHEYAGVYLENVQGCVLKNNVLINNTYGFYMAKVKNCVIQGNVSISNAKSEVLGGNGLHMWYCSDSVIRNNVFLRHRDGIYLEFSDRLDIEDNIDEYNIRYGLHFMFSHHNRFIGNVFRKNDTGVAVMYSHDIYVRGNRFEDSRGLSSYGMLLKDITDSRFEDNIFRSNTYGIYMDNASRNRFTRNRIEGNGRALEIPGNCDDNMFEANDFLSNFFDVSTNTRSTSNHFKENYWSHYDGYDLDGDGTGDVPFRPVSVFSFWVSRYPFLSILLLSPVVEFLEEAERAYPVMTPTELEDRKPRMEPVEMCHAKRGSP